MKKYWTWQATHCALLEWLTSNNSKLPIIGAFPRGLPLETIVTIVITIENHCYRCHHPSLVWLSSPLSLVWLSSPLFPSSVSISSQCIYHHWYHCHPCHQSSPNCYNWYHNQCRPTDRGSPLWSSVWSLLPPLLPSLVSLLSLLSSCPNCYHNVYNQCDILTIIAFAFDFKRPSWWHILW